MTFWKEFCHFCSQRICFELLNDILHWNGKEIGHWFPPCTSVKWTLPLAADGWYELQEYIFRIWSTVFFFLIRIVGGGVQAGSTRHVGHWMAYCTCPGWVWWWRIWWNENWQGNRRTRRKPAPAPLCPPQIPLDQTRARTRAAALGSQWLTAMARPSTVLAPYYSYSSEKQTDYRLLKLLGHSTHIHFRDCA
jgi:hypothetical protein